MAEWKLLIDASVHLDVRGVKQLAGRLAAQLLADEDALKCGETPSSLAIEMPRKSGRVDKANNLAHEVAWALFPPESDSGSDNTWSIIRYSQLVSRLSKVLRDKRKQVEQERLLARRSAAHLDENAYCLMKSRPISEHVMKPKPMPVELTELSEFEPFFTFLRSNTFPWDASSFPPGAEMDDVGKVEYRRGIFYSDGRMDLCKQVVGPKSIGPLLESLQGNSHVRHFLLGNNLIGAKGANAISKFLATRPNISTWYLAGNCIDAEGIGLIADALAGDTVVRDLWLKRNPIGPLGAVHLSTLLSSNNALQTLDLNNCGLLDRGVASLLQGLKSNIALQHLYLGANGITCQGADSLAEYFVHCAQDGKHGLVSLYLSVNRIGNDGAARLAEALRQNESLQRLNLGSNQIEAQGMASLCAALSNHKALRVLCLGMYTSTTDMGELPNRIGDQGATYLADLVRSNSNLVLLDVNNNDLTAEGWAELAAAALHSPSLLHIDAERFVKKDNELQQQLLAHFARNIHQKYGITRSEWLQKHLKYVRNHVSARYIVSLYRTRDFQNKRTRKNMKKWWDAGDNTLDLVSQA